MKLKQQLRQDQDANTMHFQGSLVNEVLNVEGADIRRLLVLSITIHEIDRIFSNQGIS